jgi:hypothetical protein
MWSKSGGELFPRQDQPVLSVCVRRVCARKWVHGARLRQTRSRHAAMQSRLVGRDAVFFAREARFASAIRATSRAVRESALHALAPRGHGPCFPITRDDFNTFSSEAGRSSCLHGHHRRGERQGRKGQGAGVPSAIAAAASRAHGGRLVRQRRMHRLMGSKRERSSVDLASPQRSERVEGKWTPAAQSARAALRPAPDGVEP